MEPDTDRYVTGVAAKQQQAKPSSMHLVTLPGTTFTAVVNSEEVDLDKFLVSIFRTNGGKMTKRNGKSVPNEKTEHLFPVTQWLGEYGDHQGVLRARTRQAQGLDKAA